MRCIYCIQVFPTTYKRITFSKHFSIFVSWKTLIFFCRRNQCFSAWRQNTKYTKKYDAIFKNYLFLNNSLLYNAHRQYFIVNIIDGLIFVSQTPVTCARKIITCSFCAVLERYSFGISCLYMYLFHYFLYRTLSKEKIKHRFNLHTILYSRIIKLIPFPPEEGLLNVSFFLNIFHYDITAFVYILNQDNTE